MSTNSKTTLVINQALVTISQPTNTAACRHSLTPLVDYRSATSVDYTLDRSEVKLRVSKGNTVSNFQFLSKETLTFTLDVGLTTGKQISKQCLMGRCDQRAPSFLSVTKPLHGSNTAYCQRHTAKRR